MRQIGYIESREEAQRFSDYLLTEGISCKLESGGDCWTLWIHDERHVEPGREALKQFQANPEDPRYTSVSEEAGLLRREEAKREKEHAKNVVAMRSRWRSASGYGRTPVTLEFLLAMVVVTLSTNFGRDNRFAPGLYYRSHHIKNVATGEIVSELPELRQGQVWRLITPIFMHGSILHIIFNAYMFFQFARLIEARRGSLRLVGLIIFAAAVSNTAEFWISDFRGWPDGIVVPNSHFLGMSGVIYGLFGYAWTRGKYDPSSGLRLNPQVVFILVLWLVICLFGFMPIANVAHVTGLLSGMAVGGWPLIVGRRF